jgi:hypothetical protein
MMETETRLSEVKERGEKINWIENIITVLNNKKGYKMLITFSVRLINNQKKWNF